jgi:hypothetical protein
MQASLAHCAAPLKVMAFMLYLTLFLEKNSRQRSAALRRSVVSSTSQGIISRRTKGWRWRSLQNTYLLRRFDMIYLHKKEHQICKKHIPESDEIRNRAEASGPSGYKGHTMQASSTPMSKHSNPEISQTKGQCALFAHNPEPSHIDYLLPHLCTLSASQARVSSSTLTPSLTLSVQIAASKSSEQIVEAIQIVLVRKLSHSLVVDPSDFGTSRPASACETDSLVAVKMKD